MMEEKGAVCLVSAHKCVSGWQDGWLAQALTHHFTKGGFIQQNPIEKTENKGNRYANIYIFKYMYLNGKAMTGLALNWQAIKLRESHFRLHFNNCFFAWQLKCLKGF